jgi:adenosine deaminase
MCPISNVKTGVVRRLAEHPLKAFLERGLCVTVNTDDPLMFDNPLNLEYARLMDELGLERPQVVALLHNAISASWLDDDGKERLRRQLERAGAEDGELGPPPHNPPIPHPR